MGLQNLQGLLGNPEAIEVGPPAHLFAPEWVPQLCTRMINCGGLSFSALGWSLQ